MKKAHVLVVVLILVGTASWAYTFRTGQWLHQIGYQKAERQDNERGINWLKVGMWDRFVMGAVTGTSNTEDFLLSSDLPSSSPDEVSEWLTIGFLCTAGTTAVGAVAGIRNNDVQGGALAGFGIGAVGSLTASLIFSCGLNFDQVIIRRVLPVFMGAVICAGILVGAIVGAYP